MSYIISITGPSGVGKNAITARLRNIIMPNFVSISCTTRPPRGDEIHGREYYFTSPEQFNAHIRKHEFAEWAQWGKHRYGTLIKPLETALRERKVIILDLETRGARDLKRVAEGKDWPLFDAFIHPPSMEELERRLRARDTESEEQVQERLKLAKHEIGRAGEFSYQFTNQTGGIGNCLAEIVNACATFRRSIRS